MTSAASVREVLEPRLVDLIAGLRRHQVEEAVGLLLDYIDAQAGPAMPAVSGESEAFELFRTFVRDNAKALRMVAHWADGRCSCAALLEMLVAELQLADSKSLASRERAAGTSPLFVEDGGVGDTA